MLKLFLSFTHEIDIKKSLLENNKVFSIHTPFVLRKVGEEYLDSIYTHIYHATFRELLSLGIVGQLITHKVHILCM